MIMIKFPRMNMKNINRFVLIALLCAPIVYLFGSLFTALNGAHGVFPFAEPVYTEEYVQVDNYVNDGSSYKILIPDDQRENFYSSLNQGVTSRLSFTSSVNSTTFRGIYRGTGTYPNFNIVFIGPSSSDNVVVFDFGTYVYSDVYIYTSDDFTLFARDYLVYYKLLSVPTDVVPIGEGANSDYIFGQFFAKDNFLSQMGKEALSDSEQGFYPANALLRVLDENVLHYGSDNNTACMAYGYFVWVFNVVLLDMVVYLSMKLLLLPLKAVDVFERGNDL